MKYYTRSPLAILFLTIISFCITVFSCRQTNNDYQMGTYEYDKAFFRENGIDFLELTSRDNLSRILVVPAWQGRVMTSTSGGGEGRSYGWINYSLIESGETDAQFNPYGGEERFWLGPEGVLFPYTLGRAMFRCLKTGLCLHLLIQRVMHFEGEEVALSALVKSLFNLDLDEIANKF